jgi:hypothetical protein
MAQVFLTGEFTADNSENIGNGIFQEKKSIIRRQFLTDDKVAVVVITGRYLLFDHGIGALFNIFQEIL